MRADRLLRLMLILQRRGKQTTQALADELGVARRTILRDIDALSAAGVPIYTESGHGGGVALDEGYRVSLTGLNENELRALFVSGYASLLEELGLGAGAESGLLKLFAALPALHRQAVEHFRQRVHIDPHWWWYSGEDPPFWEDLQQAVDEDRCIQTVYETFEGDLNERRLEAYGLVSKAGVWYLVAHHPGGWRVYRAARFHRVRLLEERFARAPGFDLAGFWRTHTAQARDTLPRYRFRLRLAEERLGFLKENLPGYAELVEKPDTAGWVTAEVRVFSEDTARMLVFGLGAQAQVLEPPELKEAVARTAREVLGLAP